MLGGSTSLSPSAAGFGLQSNGAVSNLTVALPAWHAPHLSPDQVLDVFNSPDLQRIALPKPFPPVLHTRIIEFIIKGRPQVCELHVPPTGLDISEELLHKRLIMLIDSISIFTAPFENNKAIPKMFLVHHLISGKWKIAMLDEDHYQMALSSAIDKDTARGDIEHGCAFINDQSADGPTLTINMPKCFEEKKQGGNQESDERQLSVEGIKTVMSWFQNPLLTRENRLKERSVLPIKILKEGSWAFLSRWASAGQTQISSAKPDSVSKIAPNLQRLPVWPTGLITTLNAFEINQFRNLLLKIAAKLTIGRFANADLSISPLAQDLLYQLDRDVLMRAYLGFDSQAVDQAVTAYICACTIRKIEAEIEKIAPGVNRNIEALLDKIQSVKLVQDATKNAHANTEGVESKPLSSNQKSLGVIQFFNLSQLSTLEYYKKFIEKRQPEDLTKFLEILENKQTFELKNVAPYIGYLEPNGRYDSYINMDAMGTVDEKTWHGFKNELFTIFFEPHALNIIFHDLEKFDFNQLKMFKSNYEITFVMITSQVHLWMEKIDNFVGTDIPVVVTLGKKIMKRFIAIYGEEEVLKLVTKQDFSRISLPAYTEALHSAVLLLDTLIAEEFSEEYNVMQKSPDFLLARPVAD